MKFTAFAALATITSALAAPIEVRFTQGLPFPPPPQKKKQENKKRRREKLTSYFGNKIERHFCSERLQSQAIPPHTKPAWPCQAFPGQPSD